MKGKLDIKDYTGNMRGGPSDIMSLWAQINRDFRERELASIKWLVDNLGISAVHPDDGWVDRDRNIFTLMYPPYREIIKAGSLVALGNSTDGYRIVQVTSKADNLWSTENTEEWHFEEVWANPLKERKP